MIQLYDKAVFDIDIKMSTELVVNKTSVNLMSRTYFQASHDIIHQISDTSNCGKRFSKNSTLIKFEESVYKYVDQLK